MTIDQKVYSPCDYVYYDIPENKRNILFFYFLDIEIKFHIIVPGIIYIERLWTNTEGIKMMYGNVFMRPFETYHTQNRKFLEQVNTKKTMQIMSSYSFCFLIIGSIQK